MARMVGERFSVTEVVDHPSRSPLVKIMCDDTWGSSSVDIRIHTREGSDARDNEKRNFDKMLELHTLMKVPLIDQSGWGRSHSKTRLAMLCQLFQFPFTRREHSILGKT